MGGGKGDPRNGDTAEEGLKATENCLSDGTELQVLYEDNSKQPAA